MGYNVDHNLIGMVPNAQIASAPVKELQPLISRALAIHGGQVKKEICCKLHYILGD